MRVTAEVELERAQIESVDAPGQALDTLKSLLDIINQTADVDSNVRRDLRVRVESALRSVSRRKFEFDNSRALADANRARVLALQQTVSAFANREEEISQLINRLSLIHI